MESSASSLKHRALEALNKLSDTSVHAIMENGLHEWAALSAELGFTTALPEKPPLPPAPQEPAFGAPPREDDPTYAVELTALDRLLASRRIKKQNASLRRFEKDRKAWNEDRAYAIGLHEHAKKQHRRDVDALEAGYATAVGQWKSDFEAYLSALVHRAA